MLPFRGQFIWNKTFMHKPGIEVSVFLEGFFLLTGSAALQYNFIPWMTIPLNI